MFVRSVLPSAILLCTTFSPAPAQNPPSAPELPTAEEAALIEAHASAWHLVLKREQLRAMTKRWGALTAEPDSAAACFAEMLPVAESIVDQLALTTGFPRANLMRWLEGDVGLKPYFFPPHPEQNVEQKKSGLWKFLGPLVPIVLYRVVDRMLD